MTEGPRRSPHLHAVDVVRFLTVGGVIAVHVTSLTAPRTSVIAGGVLVMAHVTREVFLFLSAFVLGYSYRVRPMERRAFWRRRYPLVAVPYVAWSAIYVLTAGDKGSALDLVGRFGLDLLDGGAHFHLYFLLVTLQLYLVFPALLFLLRRYRRAQVGLLVASVAFELAFCAGAEYGWRPPVLGIWLSHGGSWLPTYELYIVGGLLAALHFEAVTAWVGTHRRLIATSFVASLGLGLTTYLVNLHVLGYTPLHAAAVFQPVVVVESVTTTLALYALGLWVTQWAKAAHRRFLERASDVSFGVYLGHPLLVAGLLDLAAASGASAAFARLPEAVVELVALVAFVPLVYAISYVAVSYLRRGRLSLYLTGRRAPDLGLQGVSSPRKEAPDAAPPARLA